MTYRSAATLAAALLPTLTWAAAPPNLKTLTIDSGRTQNGIVALAGRDALQQLIVTGQTADGQLLDLSREVTYSAAPADIVRIDSTGLVLPLQEGQATVTAQLGGVKATTKLAVSHIVNDVPVNFANQVVPIFTKFGCNAGGCHGKASGQNGFKLSLLGFEPPDDYEYIVKEVRGRRLFPAAPTFSLLLMKATGTAPHGGGKKLDLDSPFYRILLRWIEQGAPYGKSTDPSVTRIEVFPHERILQRGGEQQLAVVAHLSDGSTVDVTRMTQFESNYGDLAEVSASGLVSTKQIAGTAAIMARFQSHVDVFRANVPLGAPVEKLPPTNNFIDKLVFQQLKGLGLPPSELCDDGTFIRRVSVDICGRLPTKEETEAFLADKAADKHAKLVDRLLDSPEYADYFANKWSAILRNRRNNPNDDPKPTVAFHGWIRESLQQNRPYDELVRGVLTVSGEETKEAPTVWYREVKEASAQVEDVAQLFLGQRIACARCHHHPFEKWSQQDYYGMQAFFSRLEVKDPPPPKSPGKGKPTPPKEPLTVAFKPGVAQAVNPKTNKPVKPTGLGAAELKLGNDEDPRPKLVDWMVQKDNPFFARSLANRYWKHFLGRGLVEPEDDMRVTNPPSNPELLDALAGHFTEHQYDLKDLVRIICSSSVYRLSAVPNQFNATDRQNYSRFLPKRLNAEVLLDAVDGVTLVKSNFKGMPAGTKAVQLPDNQFESYFLSVFGRPDSASACECERSSDATLAQCLHLFNSQELLNKFSSSAGRAAQLTKDKRPDVEKLRELYVVALSREPSAEELKALTAHIEKRKDSVQGAYEDIVWALVNTKEFLFNH